MGGCFPSSTLLRKSSKSVSKLSQDGMPSVVVSSDDVDDADDDDNANPPTLTAPPPVPPLRTDDTNAALLLNDDVDDVERTTAKPCAFTANINNSVTENDAANVLIIRSSY